MQSFDGANYSYIADVGERQQAEVMDEKNNQYFVSIIAYFDVFGFLLE